MDVERNPFSGLVDKHLLMNPIRLPHLINGALVLLLLGGSLLVYPSLPEQIPQNAGFLGGSVSYWETTLLHWLVFTPFCYFHRRARVWGSLYGRPEPTAGDQPNPQPGHLRDAFSPA